MRANYYIGLMSGTSLDGIDVALVDIQDLNNATLIAGDTFELTSHLKTTLHSLSTESSIDIDVYGQAQRQFAIECANAINSLLTELSLNFEDIVATGSHGVTVRHRPELALPFSIQLDNGAVIAELTKIDVVNDFRSADIAAGGQGAPLVPAFHQAMLETKLSVSNLPTFVLNLGGIANITALLPNQDLVGFDTGPANTLLDSWCLLNTGNSYDKNGDWAATGDVHIGLLNTLLEDPYFQREIPKSTGKETFNIEWLHAVLARAEFIDIAASDVQSTLTHLTAKSVADSISQLASEGIVLVCGGGVHNQCLMQSLTQYLPKFDITSSNEMGLDPDYMEAMAFAWLAYCRVNLVAAGKPECTGAKSAKVLGAWYPA